MGVQHDADTRWHTAVHEAGHAVAAQSLGFFSVQQLMLGPLPCRGACLIVRDRFAHDGLDESESRLWRVHLAIGYAMVISAGLLAEMALGGAPHSESIIADQHDTHDLAAVAMALVPSAEEEPTRDLLQCVHTYTLETILAPNRDAIGRIARALHDSGAVRDDKLTDLLADVRDGSFELSDAQYGQYSAPPASLFDAVLCVERRRRNT